MRKRLLTLALMLILLLTLVPAQTFAAKSEQDLGLRYLNIGDSIAYGLSADPGLSYFGLFAQYLGSERFGLDPNWPMTMAGGVVNLGLPGLDSVELLMALKGEFSPSMTDPHYELQVQLLALIPQADVITLSIGGNNLLTPVIATVFAMYGLNPLFNTEQDLMTAIMMQGEMAWNMKLAAFTESALSSEPMTLGSMLEARTAQFLIDWPAILNRIEVLNPNADIIAMTLYNPIEKSDNEALFNRYEALVRPMNMVMMRTQNRVMLANVANTFRKDPDAVAFRLTWVDAGLYKPPVLIDPHPTTLGHQLIFEELMKVRNPWSFK